MNRLAVAACIASAVAGLAGCRAPSSPPGNASAVYPADAEQNTRASASKEEPLQRRGRRERDGLQPGSFDFYLLNLSWSPEYCATHAGAAECAAHRGFVVHGLWPQNADGTYPQNCSNAAGPANPKQYLDLQPTVSLVMHEWHTHGTCSGLAPDAYFAAVRKTFHSVVIPASFQQGHVPPGTSAPAAILAQFASTNPRVPQGGFALSCGNNQLTAIELCFNRSLQPEACQGVRSCRANVVGIAAP